MEILNPWKGWKFEIKITIWTEIPHGSDILYNLSTKQGRVPGIPNDNSYYNYLNRLCRIVCDIHCFPQL